MYCGRPSGKRMGTRQPYGNMFVVQRGGGPAAAAKEVTRYARSAIFDEMWVRDVQRAFHGKIALCHCRKSGATDPPCHGAFIVRVAHADDTEMARMRQLFAEQCQEVDGYALNAERAAWARYRRAHDADVSMRVPRREATRAAAGAAAPASDTRQEHGGAAQAAG